MLKILEKHRSSYADWQESRQEPTPSRQELAERTDWPRITPDWLFATEECLSFVEPEGFRFLLPA